MNRVAFANWNGRIAPVFDIATGLHIVDSDNGSISNETDELIRENSPVRKARLLSSLAIDALVCGAISRPLQEAIEERGIRIYAFVAGDLQEVMYAWVSGRLESDAFAMPGCGGRRRGQHCRRRGRG
jgi:predicted Fe-Mo cluster-binding NifX family protein